MLPKPSSERLLFDSEFLYIIKVAGYTSNLSLTTCVRVNTLDNSTKVTYKVDPWNTKLKRLEKTFCDYYEAYDYYVKLYTKFRT